MIADLPTGQSWTEGQRQFLAALEKAGANNPEYALPVDKVSPLPVRELQALVDSGVVREASSNGYYLYPRQIRASTPDLPTSAGLTPFTEPFYRAGMRLRSSILHREPLTAARLVKVICFWLIMILIPIILIQLTSR